MWSKEKIIEVFSDIMKSLTGIEFENKIELKKEKLLGEKINLKARDLLIILYKVEKTFSVSIPEKSIYDGNFDTYDHILGLLFLLLVN